MWLSWQIRAEDRRARREHTDVLRSHPPALGAAWKGAAVHRLPGGGSCAAPPGAAASLKRKATKAATSPPAGVKSGGSGEAGRVGVSEEGARGKRWAVGEGGWTCQPDADDGRNVPSPRTVELPNPRIAERSLRWLPARCPLRFARCSLPLSLLAATCQLLARFCPPELPNHPAVELPNVLCSVPPNPRTLSVFSPHSSQSTSPLLHESTSLFPCYQLPAAACHLPAANCTLPNRRTMAG